MGETCQCCTRFVGAGEGECAATGSDECLVASIAARDELHKIIGDACEALGAGENEHVLDAAKRVAAEAADRRRGLAGLFITTPETRAELREHVDRLWADAGFDAPDEDEGGFCEVYRNDFRRVLDAVRGALNASPPAGDASPPATNKEQE